MQEVLEKTRRGAEPGNKSTEALRLTGTGTTSTPVRSVVSSQVPLVPKLGSLASKELDELKTLLQEQATKREQQMLNGASRNPNIRVQSVQTRDRTIGKVPEKPGAKQTSDAPRVQDYHGPSEPAAASKAAKSEQQKAIDTRAPQIEETKLMDSSDRANLHQAQTEMFLRHVDERRAAETLAKKVELSNIGKSVVSLADKAGLKPTDSAYLLFRNYGYRSREYAHVRRALDAVDTKVGDTINDLVSKLVDAGAKEELRNLSSTLRFANRPRR